MFYSPFCPRPTPRYAIWSESSDSSQPQSRCAYPRSSPEAHDGKVGCCLSSWWSRLWWFGAGLTGHRGCITGDECHFSSAIRIRRTKWTGLIGRRDCLTKSYCLEKPGRGEAMIRPKMEKSADFDNQRWGPSNVCIAPEILRYLYLTFLNLMFY